MTKYAISSTQRLPNDTETMGCSICYEIMANPSSLSCGHGACLVCLKEWFRRGGTDCPTCRKAISGQVKAGLTVNITLRQALQALIPPSVYNISPPVFLISSPVPLNIKPVSMFSQPVIMIPSPVPDLVVNDGEFSGKYFGQLKDGVMHGQGKIIYTSSNYKEYVFEGEWKGGKREGGGRIVYPDGRVRKGTWDDGKLVSFSYS